MVAFINKSIIILSHSFVFELYFSIIFVKKKIKKLHNRSTLQYGGRESGMMEYQQILKKG